MVNLIIKYTVTIFFLIPQFSYGFSSSLSSEDKVSNIILINKNTSKKDLINILITLDEKKNMPIDDFIYGYLNVYLANIYNKEKEYSKASESIKKAFYYIDKSVESNIENWRLRYLRLRVDAFVPLYLGRCDVSLIDSVSLLSDKRIDDELKYIIKYMYAKSLINCKKNKQANIMIEQLLRGRDYNNIISKYGINNNIPWFPIEIDFVISYLICEKKNGC